MSAKPEKIFGHRFPGEVWAVVPDCRGGKLLIQTRNNGEARLLHHVYDFSDNDLIRTGLEYSISESGGIWDTGNDKAFLFKNLRTEFIKREGICVIDLKTGAELFSSDDFTPVGWTGNEIIVEFAMSERRAIFDTGTFQLTGFGKTVTSHVRKRAVMLTPSLYTSGDVHYERIKAFLEDKGYIDVSDTFEYLEDAELAIIGFYVPSTEGLTHYALCIGQEGSVVDKIKLGSSLRGIGIDTFAIINHHLLTVSDKHDLEIYILPF